MTNLHTFLLVSSLPGLQYFLMAWGRDSSRDLPSDQIGLSGHTSERGTVLQVAEKRVLFAQESARDSRKFLSKSFRQKVFARIFP